MADVTAGETASYPAQSFVKSYFSDLPTDLKYVKTEYTQIVPHTATDANSTNIEFVLEKMDSPFVYCVSDILLKATVTITKADGKSLPGRVFTNRF